MGMNLPENAPRIGKGLRVRAGGRARGPSSRETGEPGAVGGG
jgi:hypothetical protein